MLEQQNTSGKTQNWLFLYFNVCVLFKKRISNPHHFSDSSFSCGLAIVSFSHPFWLILKFSVRRSLFFSLPFCQFKLHFPRLRDVFANLRCFSLMWSNGYFRRISSTAYCFEEESSCGNWLSSKYFQNFVGVEIKQVSIYCLDEESKN